MKNIFLTKKEILEIENLHYEEILDYVKDFEPEKKELAMMLFEKECQLSFMKAIINEKY